MQELNSADISPEALSKQDLVTKLASHTDILNTSKNRAFLKPERLEGETYEEYKARRKAGNQFVKETRTNLFWDSYRLGTYIKPLAKPSVLSSVSKVI